jgi:S-adenosylmethionine decarboxylase
MPDSSAPISLSTDGLSLGTHIIAEFYGAANLSNTKDIRREMIAAAEDAGAIVLDACFHGFGEGHGVTGVVVLAESHISIHTWPENDYAAIDVFMCGKAEPERAITYLRRYFSPTDVETKSFRRGEPGQLDTAVCD